MRSFHVRVTLGVCITMLAAAPGARAQQGGGMAGMAGMDHHDKPAALSAKTRQEIADVRAALTPLTSTDAAKSAGFEPKFGWIATMGVHWVDVSRMSKAAQSTLKSPDNLMFSRINGRDSLVGAAFAYLTQAGDTVVPPLFDSHPPWHEHEGLAPPGQTLVMLHVWFVASPDGPFAGTNPNLPFWAAGLAAPDSARMHDAAFSARVRRAALAIGEALDSTSIFPKLGGRPAMQPYLAPRRDSVRVVIAELLAAQKAADAARCDRAADRAAALWDSIYRVYLGAARTPDVRQRIERQASMLLGQHKH
ncbi:MAG: hypothetical protein ACREN6_13060 [Gemmatimonadaceae bacterium]